ncbi:g2271 [Coccomyxa viridis]|uniref:G2271 protein n=1 Tax=Coccomyxa viridis TaxID=1274662 RepID=A0ABP1FLL7_9CHLO
MPPSGASGAAGSRIAVPRASSEVPKPGIGSGLYVADGPGLELVAPNVPTTFEVRNVSGAAIKASSATAASWHNNCKANSVAPPAGHLPSSAANLRVSVKGSASVINEVRERKDGGLEVSHAAPVSGEYKISISIGPTPVPGSPFRVSCQQPYSCEKLSKVWTGAWEWRLLTANVLEGSTVLYPAEVRPSQREGAYEVSFEPEMSGVYRLAVYLEGGQALTGSPFPVRAKEDETVAASCKMYGGGLTRAVAGQETSFTIQAVDGRNNARLMGGDTFDIEISGPGNAAPKAEVTDNDDGTYTVQWSTDKAGNFLITAWLEECEVGGCAKACSVQPAEMCAERCSREGTGLSQAQAGEPTCFKVMSRDRFGNLQTAGGDDISVQVASAAGDQRALENDSTKDQRKSMYMLLWDRATQRFTSKDYKACEDFCTAALGYTEADAEAAVARQLALAHLAQRYPDRSPEDLGIAAEDDPSSLADKVPKLKAVLMQEEARKALHRLRPLMNSDDASLDFMKAMHSELELMSDEAVMKQVLTTLWEEAIRMQGPSKRPGDNVVIFRHLSVLIQEMEKDALQDSSSKPSNVAGGHQGSMASADDGEGSIQYSTRQELARLYSQARERLEAVGRDSFFGDNPPRYFGVTCVTPAKKAYYAEDFAAAAELYRACACFFEAIPSPTQDDLVVQRNTYTLAARTMMDAHSYGPNREQYLDLAQTLLDKAAAALEATRHFTHDPENLKRARTAHYAVETESALRQGRHSHLLQLIEQAKEIYTVEHLLEVVAYA